MPFEYLFVPEPPLNMDLLSLGPIRRITVTTALGFSDKLQYNDSGDEDIFKRSGRIRDSGGKKDLKAVDLPD